jgi:tetraacyldisaccharide 4'-kinase
VRRPGWLERRSEDPLRRLALLPLDVAAWLYGAVAWLHRLVYRIGLRRPARLGCRVVSIGNLLVGGSGKTPTAAWLAAELRRRGHKVALASRGHGRRDREPVRVVSDGRFVHATSEQAGDEPLLLAAHAPGVPVLVGRDRALVGLRAISGFGAEVLLLDDGFQHHRLARDLEIVLFDGAGLGNGRVLPRGPLREPRGALRFADAIGVVDGPLPAEDEALLRRLAPGALRFAGRRRPVWLRPLGGGTSTPPESLAGTEVGLLAGIARPEGLRRTLEGLGARVVVERVFPDHHRYRAADVADLVRHGVVWITTEKDALKLPASWTAGARVLVLGIELEVEAPERLLDWLEARLR